MQRTTIQYLSLVLFLGMLTWGVYTMLVYFGIPVHGQVLLAQAGRDYVDGMCGALPLCRGFFGLLPSVIRTFGKAAPFAWYGMLTLVAYGAYLVWHAFRHGHMQLSFRMRPWHIFGFFLLSLWGIFTVLSFSDLGNGESPLRLVEPHPSIYQGDDARGLQVLQENFDRLIAVDCLWKVGEVRPGIGDYRVKFSCVQQSFLVYVLSQVLFLTLLLFVFLTAGRALLWHMRLRSLPPLLESVISLCAGMCMGIVVLWFMAVFGIFSPIVAWGVLIATLLFGARHVWYWLRSLHTHVWDFSCSWRSLALLFSYLLVSYLALNFLVVVRPFPIGWDDLGSYLNRPKLLVSYGSFIPSMSSFQWEYLSALGYLFFGYNSTFGSTAAMLINWSAGLLAILVVIAFTRTFLRGGAALAALLYYSLPIVGHFSFADMKTDNAVFAFQAISILCLFLYLFPFSRDEAPRRRWQWIALAGAFCAFGFGTKATAIMTFMMLGTVLLGSLVHWSGFFGGVLLAFVVFEVQGPLGIERIAQRVHMGEWVSSQGFSLVFSLFGIAILIIAFLRNRKAAFPAARAVFVFVASFFLCILPWIIHNNVQAGNTVPTLLLDAPNTITPVMDYSGTDVPNAVAPVRSLTGALVVDRSHPACVATGREEELGRYWGFGDGWGHYLLLPWRTVMNIDSAGYYVTSAPFLLLFPLLLLLPYFWMSQGRWLRWLFAGTVFLVVQWMFLANGVPWYGISMFLGLCIGVAAFTVRAPDRSNRWIALLLIGGSLLSNFSMRLWQFEQQRNLLEYPIGKVSAETMRKRTIPHYDTVTEVILERYNTMPDRPYVYRVGTFLPYFIPRNLEIIGITDHQLDTFRCLHQENDNQLTLQRLKALGFNSIIFDTNTATIERDIQGSLHRKVQEFVDFLNDPSLGMRAVVNDPDAGIAYILIP
ncbi:MAG: glycosyltransferase family 39 protein [Candidatus Peribacteraceae bacterium]